MGFSWVFNGLGSMAFGDLVDFLVCWFWASSVELSGSQVFFSFRATSLSCCSYFSVLDLGVSAQVSMCRRLHASEEP